MEADREQAPHKLVYLRDHTPRSRVRAPRLDRRQGATPPPDLASEATWLGRSLIALAVLISAYWLAIVTGAVHIDGDEEWRWTLSHSLAHIFVAVSAVISGRLLLRHLPLAPLIAGLVSGALVVTALEGLTRMVVGGGMSQVSLGARTDVLTKAAKLVIGIWAGSYALRAERRITSD